MSIRFEHLFSQFNGRQDLNPKLSHVPISARPFGQLVNWSTCSSVKSMFSTCHLAKLSFYQLVFCQFAIILACHFVNLLFCQISISSTCHFVNLPFCQLAILSTCHSVNLPFCQLAILPTCHFVNLPFCQLAILSTCHSVNLPFCQLAILSTCHSAKLPFLTWNFANLPIYKVAIFNPYK